MKWKKVFLKFTEQERELYLSLIQRHIDMLKQEMSNAFDKKWGITINMDTE